MEKEMSELVGVLVGALVPFLPVLFGAVEFVKAKTGIEDGLVEWMAVGLGLLFGGLIVLAYYFPGWGLEAAAVFLFLIMAALAPSGFYKFTSARVEKIRG